MLKSAIFLFAFTLWVLSNQCPHSNNSKISVVTILCNFSKKKFTQRSELQFVGFPSQSSDRVKVLAKSFLAIVGNLSRSLLFHLLKSLSSLSLRILQLSSSGSRISGVNLTILKNTLKFGHFTSIINYWNTARSAEEKIHKHFLRLYIFSNFFTKIVRGSSPFVRELNVLLYWYAIIPPFKKIFKIIYLFAIPQPTMKHKFIKYSSPCYMPKIPARCQKSLLDAKNPSLQPNIPR